MGSTAFSSRWVRPELAPGRPTCLARPHGCLQLQALACLLGWPLQLRWQSWQLLHAVWGPSRGTPALAPTRCSGACMQASTCKIYLAVPRVIIDTECDDPAAATFELVTVADSARRFDDAHYLDFTLHRPPGIPGAPTISTIQVSPANRFVVTLTPSGDIGASEGRRCSDAAAHSFCCLAAAPPTGCSDGMGGCYRMLITSLSVCSL